MSQLLESRPMSDTEVADLVDRARKPKKVYSCRLCGEAGHTAARCDRRPKRWRGRPSRSRDAAILAHDEGLTFHEAAARVGVTPQAVQQAWVKTFPDEPSPTSLDRGWRRWQAISLVLGGLDVVAAANESGLHEQTARAAVRNAGIRLAPRYPERDLAEAVAAVANGAAMIDAATEAGVSRGVLQRALDARGVRSTATARGRRNGRGARAWALVEQGVPIPEAARRERVSSCMLYAKRARLRREAAGGAP